MLKKIIRDLFEGDHGKISHTKAWANVAYAVGSWVIIELTLSGKMEVDYLFLYLLVVAGHGAASKGITAWAQSKGNQPARYGGYSRGYSYDMSDRDPRVNGAKKTPEDEEM